MKGDSMKSFIAASLIALSPALAFAQASDRAVELAKQNIIIDGHVDAPHLHRQ